MRVRRGPETQPDPGSAHQTARVLSGVAVGRGERNTPAFWRERHAHGDGGAPRFTRDGQGDAFTQNGHPADGTPAGLPTMRLMGAPIGAVTELDAVHAIIAAAQRGRSHWTITANLDHVRRYHSEPVARELIDEADLVVADGMPLVWASRVAGEPLPERVAGSSMVWSICELASLTGQTIFLLGGDPGVAERAADIFRERYPSLQIVGTACPEIGFMQDAEEIERVSEQLIAAAPAIVLVALGFPKQDLLIRNLRNALPDAAFVGVGISLSYVTGDVMRAPPWICNLGLEWAYRLSQEPTRLARRYLWDGAPFALLLIMSAVRHRLLTPGADGSRGWGGA